MTPFVFEPNATASIWKQDTLTNANNPAPDYTEVPIRILRSYLTITSSGTVSGTPPTFLHRFHIGPEVPLWDVITSNVDTQAWSMIIDGYPPRLYFRIRFAGAIMDGVTPVCHYALGWTLYRQ